MSTLFIGREQELQTLNQLLKKRSASLVVIQGRRRIGKSRLVEEFAKDHTFYELSGIPPTEKTTMQSQLDEFARQLSLQTGLPEVRADDWGKLFVLLSEKTKRGRVIILLDEIAWMGSKDDDFLGKLKNAWDIYFKKNPKLILILCGSVSVWIEENILASTGFLGRISYRLTLEELPLSDCQKFWPPAMKVSAYEKLKVLAVTGGVPRYLEEIHPNQSAETNIKNLCFRKGGSLVNEFNEIFSDLFSKRSPSYKKMIEVLRETPLEMLEICEKLNLAQTGFVSEYLKHLVKAGFITRDYTWHLDSGKASRLSHFRLSDNYTRFYLKYIEPHKHKIDQDDFEPSSLSLLPNWETIMGLQFENLVIRNKQLIQQYLGLKPEEVIVNNPFFQRKTARLAGCQIDYLIQTKFQVLYICEVKFTLKKIGMDVVQEVEEKLRRLQCPKGFSVRPVLIHVNGVSEDLVESGCFAEIIDFGQFLANKVD